MNEQDTFDHLKYRVVVFYDQKRFYNSDGRLIRVVYKSGRKEWYQDDILHRDDGPAVEFASGRREWYQYGELHREDGPAVIDSMSRRYYLHSVLISEEEHRKQVSNKS